MYHYLFTNDLRISNLQNILKKTGNAFVTGTVPSAQENKSENNNMLTLGFYFNLTSESNCAHECAKGNVRNVVLNFIKKFQFPNPRTQESMNDCMNDKISLAPMRLIVQVLYLMNMLHPGTAFLSREEILNFIFYNENIAKNKSPNIPLLIEQIIEYRKNGVLPQNIEQHADQRIWKHEDRQIREMTKVLTWSGCVSENEEQQLYIHHDKLTVENKADLFDIINCNEFWQPSREATFSQNRENYQQYMDFLPTKAESQNSTDNTDLMPETEIEFTEKISNYDISQLGSILTQMYNAAENKTTAVHMFGLKYGSVIKENGFTANGIIAAATGIGESYSAEISKGVGIYESILKNEYGIKFHDGSDQKSEIAKNRLSVLPKRERTSFPLNCILYGAPGTGKTYATAQYALAIVENKDLPTVSAEPRRTVMERYNALVKSGQIVFTTFHQNYGYEDFIQGIRPDVSSAEMNFKSVDGVFKVVADRAMNAPEKDFVIIIDEINRANISKVFGELITLIEEDKRWGEENAICATLPSGEAFAVPNNLYIVGTMNSADKSISLIDTALRRRFEFIEYVPNLKLISDPQLRTVLEKLNSGIADELNSTDLLVGHSYFMGKKADDVCDIMNRSIIPLLYEYFFDNEKKVEAQIKKAVEGLNVEVNVSKAGRIKLVKKDVE